MKPKVLNSVVSVSVFLFFLQGLRVVFSVLFGIIYDQIFEGPIDSWLVISGLLVVLAFVVPLWAPRKNHARWAMIFASIAALARISLSINLAGVRFWGSFLTVAFGGLFLAMRLQLARRSFIQHMLSALVLDQLLRAVGDTYDISLRFSWFYPQVVWGLLIVGFVLMQHRRAGKPQTETAGIRWVDGLALCGFVFLQASLLSLPNAVSRWSDVPYFTSTAAFTGLTLIFVLPAARDLFVRVFQTSMAGIGLLLLLLMGLMLGYFSKGLLSFLGLFLAQLASLSAFTSTFVGSPALDRAPGRRVALGLGLFLILNFINAFTFTYPYTLPFLRGAGWLVFLTAGVMVGAGAIVRLASVEPQIPPELRFVPEGILLFGAFVVTLAVAWPRAEQSVRAQDAMRIATYNIHYGYDDLWHFTLEDMARSIEEADVDVVVMQEVDAGRITSYSVDDALFLARRLRMNQVYLPTVEHLTGIAVLYKGPTMPSDHQWLTSLQEQTGIIEVSLKFVGEPLNVYGIWMGLSDEDTRQQIAEALAFIGDSPNAAFGGDFNAEYHEPIPQAILEAGFEDPFVTLGIDPPPFTSPAIDPRARIDYVWLRDLRPVDAWVSTSLASDHRMVVVEIELPFP